LINSKDEYTRLLQQITVTAKRVNSSKAVKGLKKKQIKIPLVAKKARVILTFFLQIF